MAAPNTPSIIIAIADLDPTGTVRRAKAIKAKIPPSPLLLARMINITYLIETTTIKAQNTIEMTPNTASFEKGIPCCGLKHSFSAYKGLVAMSPKTTPMAPNIKVLKLPL